MAISALASLVGAIGNGNGNGANKPLSPIPVDDVIEKIKEVPAKVLSDSDKWSILRAVEKKLNKQFDTTTSIVKLGEKVGKPIPSISGDLYTLDWDVIGCGGLPRG